MRVMHVIESMRIGGAEAVVVEHVRHAAPGVTSLVCALNHGGPALEAAARAGARTFALGRPGRRLPDPIGRLARLRALLARERVEVVNAHNPTGALYGVPAARLAGVPVVCRTEHSIHYPGRHSGVYAAAEPWLTRMSDRVVCVCEAVRDSHARRLPGLAGRFVSIANGVPDAPPTRLRDDVRRELGLTGDDPALLAIGGLRPPKSFDVLIEAFARVAARAPRARLLIAGDGPLHDALAALAAARGVADRVRWLGARFDVSDLVEAADLYVVSSQREGLSLSILEALRGGRAAVVTDAGGNAEAVRDGVNGRVVPVHDPAALAAAILDLLADPARRERFGAAARAAWARGYGAERMVRETEALYRAVLDGRGAPARPLAVPDDARLIGRGGAG